MSEDLKHRIGIAIRGFALAGVLASASWALTITPGRTEIRLEPGTKTDFSITATNNTADELAIEVSKKDWFIYEANKDLTVDKWLRIHGAQSFELKPGQSRKVDLTAVCPKAAQGELVGMVSFLYRTPQPSMITPVISVSVYVAAAGTEKVSGEVAEVAVRKWKGQLQVALALKATGNVHLRPTGQVKLVDAKGQTVADIAIPEGDPTYPGQVRGYLGQVPAGLTLAPGRYTAQGFLKDRGIEMTAARAFTVKKDGDITMEAKS